MYANPRRYERPRAVSAERRRRQAAAGSPAAASPGRARVSRMLISTLSLQNVAGFYFNVALARCCGCPLQKYCGQGTVGRGFYKRLFWTCLTIGPYSENEPNPTTLKVQNRTQEAGVYDSNYSNISTITSLLTAL